MFKYVAGFMGKVATFLTGLMISLSTILSSLFIMASSLIASVVNIITTIINAIVSIFLKLLSPQYLIALLLLTGISFGSLYALGYDKVISQLFEKLQKDDKEKFADLKSKQGHDFKTMDDKEKMIHKGRRLVTTGGVLDKSKSWQKVVASVGDDTEEMLDSMH